MKSNQEDETIRNGGTTSCHRSDSGVRSIDHSDYHDSTTSPLSPTSSFSVSSIGNIEHSFVDALLLCQWDNILGPRLEHVWYINGRPQPHTNTLRFITGQVLSGEICRDIQSSQIDFKFFDIPEKGIIIPSFIFSAQNNNGLSLQSIALIIPNSELSLYLHQADLIHSWMTRIVAKLRVTCAMKHFGTSGLADLSSWLRSCMEMLSSLQEMGLPPKIELNYTALCPAHKLQPDFLRLMIASHLMTFGRSVVMGQRADRVNVLVYTLGLFCWDSERLCSRTALSGRSWPYFQDVWVQGCLKNADGSFNMNVRDLQCSMYPTTLIDVERLEVMQSCSPSDHKRLRHQALLEELEELYEGHEGYQTRPTGTFQNVNAPESIVRDLLNDLHKLPPESGIRESFIAHFMHSLQRRALCLIKCVEGDSAFLTLPNRLVTKRLRQDLGLQLDGDFRIVLATAEKLKPGLYHIVMADKKYDTEYLPNMTDVL